MKRSVFIIIAIIISGAINSQDRQYPLTKDNKKALHLCFELNVEGVGTNTLKFFKDSSYYRLFQITKEKVLEYNVDEIRIGGNFFYEFLHLNDFPLLETQSNPELLQKFRHELQWFKTKGIKISLYVGGEPTFYPKADSTFFNLYPDSKYLDNGLLWKFFEERTFSIFQLLPEADAISFHLWERPLLNDLYYFPGIRWQKDEEWYHGSNQYYSPSDYLTELISAYSRGAKKAGKEMAILTFCHYPYQEKLMIESLNELEKRNTPMVMVHKSQPGDWDPYRGPNNVMLNTNSRGMILFDGVGEYWGGSRIPYCYPEEIQYRLLNALENNKNIESVGMRVFDYFDFGSLFGNYNEINFFALSKLALNPTTPVEEIWKEWATKKFGEKAAPKIIEALKRTDDIGKKVYYFKGIWVQQHSTIAALTYLEAQVLHTGKAMLKWYPDNIIDNGLISDFMYHPSEAIIQIAVDDRKDALEMCKKSILDVESVKNLLSKVEYQKLIGQFNVQKQFIEVSIPHIEAYLRYKIYKNKPNQKNIDNLIPVLDSLEEKAKEIDSIYAKSERLLSGDRIRSYVNDIRQAIKQLN